MFAVLAVAISGTTPSPSTTNTSSGSSQRNKYDYQATRRGNDGDVRNITYNILPAANRQQHKTHSPTRTLNTFPHVRRLPRRGQSGHNTPDLRRKPSDGVVPAPKETAITWQTHKNLNTARPDEPQASTAEPAHHGQPPSTSPQEQRAQSHHSGRHGPSQHASEQSPDIRDQCRCVKRKASPQKTGGQNNLRRREKTYPDSKKIYEPPELGKIIYLTIKKKRRKNKTTGTRHKRA